jgi:glycosyltransferase involved in cell wall biosynthesis
MTGKPLRLLFSSYHCYFDPSSGAALATRDLLELLADRGWECRVYCGPHLDFEEPESLEQLLSDHHLPYNVRRSTAGPVPFSLFQFVQGAIPVTIYLTPLARPYTPPTRDEGDPFLALFERVLDRFRPDAVLTYGGHWLAEEVIACVKRRGLPVIFTLCNFAYHDPDLFRGVDAVLVPSAYSQAHYRRTLGLECTTIPCPVDWGRVLCPEVRGEYVTFVNPQPHKGVFLFARIARELGRQRPDIPLLVTEGRAKAGWLSHTGLDFSGLSNLHLMHHTPDPRDFYRVSRAVLMPSLWNESFGRVAAEALINGIPVLASRRGALPETLGHAGFLFDVPERYTPATRLVPAADEVTPWIETLIRLWDDPAFYEAQQQRCRAAAEPWRPERLGPQYDAFFTSVVRSSHP